MLRTAPVIQLLNSHTSANNLDLCKVNLLIPNQHASFLVQRCLSLRARYRDLRFLKLATLDGGCSRGTFLSISHVLRRFFVSVLRGEPLPA